MHTGNNKQTKHSSVLLAKASNCRFYSMFVEVVALRYQHRKLITECHNFNKRSPCFLTNANYVISLLYFLWNVNIVYSLKV